ncbi:Secretion protein HlyD [Parvularcula bermudensis HTCC2503]|uniref:Secretion protein HlyD n=1 Tax=Parvularcula bermudensis (strain ATCC BAA-594 / HTCC2503 / KCTC 12087) TaxID=314260 RepID=E0TIK4_PARBH|nr:HlyD family secretion protein [Parvularcula bermudensis]ADM10862.1 Secretion protein HlyD [Parvularcula bermudensis HTCC2503]
MRRSLYGIAAFVILASCGGEAAAPTKEAPATVAGARPEEELTTLSLTDDAIIRLGIETQPVSTRHVAARRSFPGTIEAAPGASTQIAAPFDAIVASTDLEWVPTGATIASGDRVLSLVALGSAPAGISPVENLAVLQKELENARARLQRTEELIAVQGASAEERELAEAEVARAEAAYNSERARLNGGQAGGIAVRAPIGGTIASYSVGPGQSVKAGDPLFRMVDTDRLIVRVAVLATEVGVIGHGDAVITQIGQANGAPVIGRRVGMAPTQGAGGNVTNVFVKPESIPATWYVGVPVDVALGVGEAADHLVIPQSALFRDIYGGTWVYERIAQSRFARRRVRVAFVEQDDAFLSVGPGAGTDVVTVGVAELAGTEFGIGK